MRSPPSAAAEQVALAVTSRGCTVTPERIQTWRQAGLLGDWTHARTGRRGSVAVAPPDAIDRAFICARLKKTDRHEPTVTILSWLVGAPIPPDVLTRQFADYIDQLGRGQLTLPRGVDPVDHAAAIASASYAGPGGAAQLRRDAAALKDVPDHSLAHDDDATPMDRALAARTELISLFTGANVDDVIAFLPEQLQLAGHGELIAHTDMADPVAAAKHGTEVAAKVPAYRDAAMNVAIDEAKATTARTIIRLITPPEDWESFVASPARITNSTPVLDLATTFMCSAIAEPEYWAAVLEAELDPARDPDRQS